MPFHVIGQHEKKDTTAHVVYDGGWMDDLIVHDGPLAKGGFVEVPDKPSLGIEFDPDVVKARLAEGEAWCG